MLCSGRSQGKDHLYGVVLTARWRERRRRSTIRRPSSSLILLMYSCHTSGGMTSRIPFKRTLIV